MDQIDKLKKQIQGMDKSKRRELTDALDSMLSDSQKSQLKSMLSSKSGKAELEKQLEGLDTEKMLGSIGSADDLKSMLKNFGISDKLGN